MIDPCTADAIVLVNQPGLTLTDLQDFEPFTVLRTYCFMSSTLGVVHRMSKPLDLDRLAQYALRKCGGSLIELQGLDEVETYIDSKKRVIRIDFPQLPEDPELRREALMDAGELSAPILSNGLLTNRFGIEKDFEETTITISSNRIHHNGNRVAKLEQ